VNVIKFRNRKHSRKRILAIGGVGFLGSHLCKRMLQQGLKDCKLFCVIDSGYMKSVKQFSKIIINRFRGVFVCFYGKRIPMRADLTGFSITCRPWYFVVGLARITCPFHAMVGTRNGALNIQGYTSVFKSYS
jgi:hypothetical protein